MACSHELFSQFLQLNVLFIEDKKPYNNIWVPEIVGKHDYGFNVPKCRERETECTSLFNYKHPLYYNLNQHGQQYTPPALYNLLFFDDSMWRNHIQMLNFNLISMIPIFGNRMSRHCMFIYNILAMIAASVCSSSVCHEDLSNKIWKFQMLYAWGN